MLYHGHRFPAIVISCAVRWYFRFNLILRRIEELLPVAGATRLAPDSARVPKRWRRKAGGTWHLDEIFVTLRRELYLLLRAVDEHGVELDLLVQKRRDKATAKRFFCRVL